MIIHRAAAATFGRTTVIPGTTAMLIGVLGIITSAIVAATPFGNGTNKCSAQKYNANILENSFHSGSIYI